MRHFMRRPLIELVTEFNRTYFNKQKLKALNAGGHVCIGRKDSQRT